MLKKHTKSKIKVAVVYALPMKQYFLTVEIPEKSTIREAIMASGLLYFRKDISLERNKVGIFGRLAKLEDLLYEGNRVEVYRSLLVTRKKYCRIRLRKEARK